MWLCFPFLNELDIMHVKLKMLAPHVERFIVSESAYDTRGHPKPMHLLESLQEPRFAQYRGQIVHLADREAPGLTDETLGWQMLKKMKDMIGQYILRESEHDKNNSKVVVIVADSDEVPSAAAAEFLAQHGVPHHVTYQLAPTMPHYIYGFVWRVRPSGYATATARSLRGERRFWSTLPHPPSELQALPVDPSGWHCSYCAPSEQCVEKLRRTNLADGPPFLGLYNWTADVFDALRGCGITPQGEPVKRAPLQVPEADEYPYLSGAPECRPYVMPY